MKTIKTFCMFLLLTSSKVNAQQHTNMEKLNLGIYLSPEYNFSTSNYRPQIRSERYSYSFSTGLNIKYQLSKNIALISGLGLGVKRYHDVAYAIQLVKRTAIIGEDNYYDLLHSNATYYEAQIPLLAQVNLWKNKFFITSGVDFTRSLVNRVKSTVLLKDNMELVNSSNSLYNNGNALALIAGFGINVKTFNSTSLSIEPMVKFYPGIGDYNNMMGTFGVKSTFYFAH